jgi:hypothetical protein
MFNRFFFQKKMTDLLRYLNRVENECRVSRKIKQNEQKNEKIKEYFNKRLCVNDFTLESTVSLSSMMCLLEKGDKSNQLNQNPCKNKIFDENYGYKNFTLSYKSTKNFTPFRQLYKKVRVFKSEKRNSINFDLNLRSTNLDLVILLQENWMIVCHQFVLSSISKLIGDRIMELYRTGPQSKVKIVDLTCLKPGALEVMLLFLEYAYVQEMSLPSEKYIPFVWSLASFLEVHSDVIADMKVQLTENLNEEHRVGHALFYPGRGNASCDGMVDETKKFWE